MRPALLCLLLFSTLHFSCLVCSAQRQTIDSLLKAERNEKEDTGKVNLLNAVSERLSGISKYDSSALYAGNALNLAAALGFEKGRADAFYALGECYYMQDNYFPSLTNLQQGLSIYSKIGNKAGSGKCFNGIGEVYSDRGDYPKALEFYFKALDLSGEVGENMTARVLYNIGAIYNYQHIYPKALEYLFKSLETNRKKGIQRGEANILCMIGIIYTNQGKYDTAGVCLFKALTLSRQRGEKELETQILGNLGDLYLDLGNYTRALDYEFRSLAITKQTRNNLQYALCLNSAGQIYAKQKKYRISEKYLDSALLVAKQIGNMELIKNVYGNRTKLDSARGNYRAALQDNNNYYLFRDSLNSEKTYQEEMNYEFSRQTDSARAVQDKKDAVKENEISNQKRIRNYAMLGFYFAFIAASIFFFQRRRITKEKKRSDALLLNILPGEVAEELKDKGSADAKQFDDVTVIFTDFKGFTSIAEQLSAKELVAEIDYCFKAFDAITEKCGIEKIKTIGDSYMAAGGLPVPNKTHAKDVVNAALEIVKFMERHKLQRIKEGKPVFEIRIGINTGPVVAGIVGVKKFAYDIWGDTVNIASRMESSGEPGRVNISGSTWQLVKNDFKCTHRGKIQAKNKGEVDMYFVDFQ